MLAIAVFAPGIANATNFKTTNSISVSSGGGGFQGKVGSSRASCVPNRTVTLQRKVAGGSKFAAIGTDKTDRQGGWSLKTSPQAKAEYKAVVNEKNLGGGNGCRAVTSKTLTARQTKSSIAISNSGASFKGKITSLGDCVGGRTVKLQRKSPGQTRFADLGSPDTSSGAGAWNVATNPVNNAQYRGSVSARTVGDDACMAADSSITTARKSTVTIEQGGATSFHGNVDSVPSCEATRTVTLQSADIYSPAFVDIGSDATNGSGAWQVNRSVVSGAFYRASLAARQAGSNSCLDDLSSVIDAS